MTCTAEAAACACARPTEHEGPHLCTCAGSWDHKPDGTFVLVNLPHDFRGLASLRRRGVIPPLH